MQTVYAFDFDGTITPVPGEYSEMFSEGSRYKNESPDQVAREMKEVMNRYLPPEKVSKIRGFFETIHHQPKSILTIQTNNYRNVVLACLVHHIGIPIDYFDLEKSCFRECKYLKNQSLNGLSCNPNIQRIVYFDDSTQYIAKAMKCGPKIAVVNCLNGNSYLGNMLENQPVIDEKSLNRFLEQFVKSQENLI